MTDTYQAIYDAVRSKIHGGDVGSAVREVALSAFDISWARDAVQQELIAAAYEWRRPSVVFRPSIYPDGSSGGNYHACPSCHEHAVERAPTSTKGTDR